MAEAQPAFSDAAGCTARVGRLPLVSPLQCHVPLSELVRLPPGASIAPAAKLEILEALRDPIAQAQGALVQGPNYERATYAG